MALEKIVKLLRRKAKGLLIWGRRAILVPVLVCNWELKPYLSANFPSTYRIASLVVILNS
jgi:hypothetical protein